MNRSTYAGSVISCLIAIMMLVCALPAAAQEDEPEPGTNAAAELPAATVFGEGWV